MKTKIVYINLASYFNNTTCQEAIKRRFEEVFVLFKVNSVYHSYQNKIVNKLIKVKSDPLKYQKTKIFCIDCFSKVALKSIIKNIHNFADKEICWWFQDEITNREKIGFEVEYEGEDLVLEEERHLFPDRRPVYHYL